MSPTLDGERKYLIFIDWLAAGSMEDEVLLIDLRSPDDGNQIILDPPVPPLSTLPGHRQNLLECDPSGDGRPPMSPLQSPLHGSCLTPSKLISQPNSPLLSVRSGRRTRLETSPLAAVNTQ